LIRYPTETIKIPDEHIPGMDELYRLVGIVMRNAQAIERNLSIVIYYDRILSVFDENDEVPKEEFNENHESADKLYDDMSWMTMGDILKLAKETPSLDQGIVDRLSRVMKHRNYVAHRMFKDRMFEVGRSETQRQLSSIKRRMSEEINISLDLNNDLLTIIGKLREEYRKIGQV